MSIQLIGIAYDDAMTMYNNGNYREAAEAFSYLGNYKDSVQMAKLATELIAGANPVPDDKPEEDIQCNIWGSPQMVLCMLSIVGRKGISVLGTWQR